VRTETTATDFLEKPFKSITRGSTTGVKYVGVEIDAKKDFESDYNNLQSSLEAYWEDVVAKHGDEAVMPGVSFRGDVVLDTPDTNIPPVKNIRDKAFKTLLGRIRQLELAGNSIDGWTQTRRSGDVVETVFSGVFPDEHIPSCAEEWYRGTVRGCRGDETCGGPGARDGRGSDNRL